MNIISCCDYAYYWLKTNPKKELKWQPQWFNHFFWESGVSGFSDSNLERFLDAKVKDSFNSSSSIWALDNWFSRSLIWRSLALMDLLLAAALLQCQTSKMHDAISWYLSGFSQTKLCTESFYGCVHRLWSWMSRICGANVNLNDYTYQNNDNDNPAIYLSPLNGKDSYFIICLQWTQSYY